MNWSSSLTFPALNSSSRRFKKTSLSGSVDFGKHSLNCSSSGLLRIAATPCRRVFLIGKASKTSPGSLYMLYLENLKTV